MDAADLARSAIDLVGTRYRPRGRRLSGVDCSGLVILAAKNIGIELPDTRRYDPALPDPSLIRRMCEESLREVRIAEMCEGCVFIAGWVNKTDGRHMGILVGDGEIVHSDAHVKRVTRVNATWLRGRLLSVWKIPQLNYGEPWSRSPLQ